MRLLGLPHGEGDCGSIPCGSTGCWPRLLVLGSRDQRNATRRMVLHHASAALEGMCFAMLVLEQCERGLLAMVTTVETLEVVAGAQCIVFVLSIAAQR